jgi:carbamoylphosphate synthase large subunit
MSPSARIIVYGIPNKTWRAALGPSGPVWAAMPEVGDVHLVEEIEEIQALGPAPETVRTVIIPTLEAQTKACPRHYPSLIPDERSVDVLSNKAAFAAFVASHDLGSHCPQTYGDAAQARFPLALKRTRLNSGIGIARADSHAELAALLLEDTWKGRAVVLQDWVGGDTEFVTHCVCKDGRILWDCSYEYRMEGQGDVRGSHNFRSITRIDTAAEVLDCLTRFLAPLGYTGPCNVDYKRTKDGSVRVFEINPRLGRSLMMPEHVDALAGCLSCIIANAG